MNQKVDPEELAPLARAIYDGIAEADRQHFLKVRYNLPQESIDALPESMQNLSWKVDEHDCLNLKFDFQFKNPDMTQEIHAWIQSRPPYCDRGHHQLNVEGVPWLDEADMFPRYFMSTQRAMDEAVEWLVWRLCGISPYVDGGSADVGY